MKGFFINRIYNVLCSLASFLSESLSLRRIPFSKMEERESELSSRAYESFDLPITIAQNNPLMFDTQTGAPETRTKLEVMASQQIDRVIYFNAFVWIVTFLILFSRIVLCKTVCPILKPIALPNGTVKLLEFMKINKMYMYFERGMSILLCLFTIAMAIIFTRRIVRNRRKSITNEQVRHHKHACIREIANF